MNRSNMPNQLDLPISWTPPAITPHGDGSFTVRPGRPVNWLTPAQFAKAVGLSRRAVYEYMGTESLPDRFIRRTGARLRHISADGLDHFVAFWNRREL